MCNPICVGVEKLLCHLVALNLQRLAVAARLNAHPPSESCAANAIMQIAFCTLRLCTQRTLIPPCETARSIFVKCSRVCEYVCVCIFRPPAGAAGEQFARTQIAVPGAAPANALAEQITSASRYCTRFMCVHITIVSVRPSGWVCRVI